MYVATIRAAPLICQCTMMPVLLRTYVVLVYVHSACTYMYVATIRAAPPICQCTMVPVQYVRTCL